MTDFSTWDILRNLLMAVRWTVVLSLVAFAGGAVIGLLVLLMRISRRAPLRRAAWAFIEVFQGTPLLMQLFLAFFGLALFGVEIPAWLAAGLALSLWSGAYLAEIWRGCVEAIPKGQWEAAGCLSLGHLQQMRYVILPQALRIAIAPTVGFVVQIIKGTALASIIGFVEPVQGGHGHHQRHLQPLYRLRAGRADLLCAVLAAIPLQPSPGKEAQCRSSPLKT